MESTFKRQYEKETLPDGSIKLTYKGSRHGAHFKAAMLVFNTGIVLFGWLISFFVIGAIAKDFTVGMVAGILLMGGVVFLYRKLFSKTTSITVRPEGIIFNKRGKTVFGGGEGRLAFRDVSGFGIATETASRNAEYTESSYIYANAGGQQISVTCHITRALAEALLAEIHQVAA